MLSKTKKGFKKRLLKGIKVFLKKVNIRSVNMLVKDLENLVTTIFFLNFFLPAPGWPISFYIHCS